VKTRRKILLGVALAALFGYIVWRGAHRGNDFKYPYLAARAVWTTGKLAVYSQPRYPVTIHVLFAPLARFDIGIAAAVWAALSFVAVGALPRVFERLTGIPPRGQLLAWVAVLPSLIDALVLGQSDPINLFLVSAGLLAAQRGRLMAGSLLVGVAGMIKILPAIHWFTILARRRGLGVWAGIVVALALSFGLIAAAVGWRDAVGGIREQLEWIRDHEKPWHLVDRQSDLRVNNESLPIVLARTLGDVGAGQPREALALGLAPLNALWITWGIILVLLATGWLAAAWRTRSSRSGRTWLGMCALTSIIMLAATPICWHHYFLWLLPATLFLRDRRRLLIAITVLSLIGSALPAARGIGIHMILALGLFALVAIDLRTLARLERSADGELAATAADQSGIV
jgi:alpha-1,2-mannosyltransferase